MPTLTTPTASASAATLTPLTQLPSPARSSTLGPAGSRRVRPTSNSSRSLGPDQRDRKIPAVCPDAAASGVPSPSSNAAPSTPQGSPTTPLAPPSRRVFGDKPPPLSAPSLSPSDREHGSLRKTSSRNWLGDDMGTPRASKKPKTKKIKASIHMPDLPVMPDMPDTHSTPSANTPAAMVAQETTTLTKRLSDAEAEWVEKSEDSLGSSSRKLSGHEEGAGLQMHIKSSTFEVEHAAAVQGARSEAKAIESLELSMMRVVAEHIGTKRDQEAAAEFENPNTERRLKWMRSERSFKRIRERTIKTPLSPVRNVRRATTAWQRVIRSLRRKARYVVTRPWFDNGIIVLILFGSILLTLDEPGDNDVETWAWIDPVNVALTVVFTLEALFKLVASRNPVGPDGYLRDVWNYLDLAVVIEGWISIFGSGSSSLKVLRCFRVLRPLRTVKRFPTLRVLTSALVTSLKRLGDIFLLVLFVMSCMGVVGVLMFKGMYTYRCFDDNLNTFVDTDTICHPGFERGCEMFAWYKTTPFTCRANQTCTEYGVPPNEGLTNFDDLPSAWVILFQVITLEGWSDQVGYAQDSYGKNSWFYFVVVVVIGAFALMQLLGAIILGTLQNTIAAEEARSRVGQHGGSGMAGAMGFDVSDSESDTEDEAQVQSDTESSSPSSVPPRPSRSMSKRTKLNSFDNPGQCVKQVALLTEDEHQHHDERDDQPAHSEATARDMAMHKFASSRFVVTRNPVCRALHAVFTKPLITHEWLRNFAIDPSQEDVELSENMKEIRQAGASAESMWQSITSTSAPLSIIIMISIFINIITLSLDGYGIDDWLATTLLWVDRVITVIFGIEMVIKLSVLGIYTYVHLDGFDGCITVGCLVELALTNVAGLSALRVVRVFRVFRVLRVARIGSNIESFALVIEMVECSLKPVSGVTVLLLLFMFVFGILGVQLLGVADDDYSRLDTDSRYNFNTFIDSVISVFVMLTGESWPAIMFTAINKRPTPSLWYSIYFVVWIVIGNYFLLNLILAILLSKSTEKLEMKLRAKHRRCIVDLVDRLEMKLILKKWKRQADRLRNEEKQSNIRDMMVIRLQRMFRHRLFVKRYRMMLRLWNEGSTLAWKKQVAADAVLTFLKLQMALRCKAAVTAITAGECQQAHPNDSSAVKQESTRADLQLHMAAVRISCFWRFVILKNRVDDQFDQQRLLLKTQCYGMAAYEQDSMAFARWREKHGQDPIGILVPKPLADVIIPFLGKSNLEVFDVVATRMLSLAIYDNLILVAILFGSVVMILEPLPDTSGIFAMRIILTFVYALDIVLKVAAHGWWAKEDGFLRSHMNRMDLVIVLSSVCHFIAKLSNAPKALLNVLFILRGGRPLRLIGRLKGCRALLKSLYHSIRELRDVTVVLLGFCFICAIMGLQLFKGSLWSCGDEGFPDGEWRYENRSDVGFPNGCENWVNADYHFDNIFDSLLTVFMVIMLEGWPGIAITVMDSVDIDYQPKKDYNKAAFLYFAVVLNFGSFLIMQLFITVVFEKFVSLRCNYHGQVVTPAQLDLIEYEDRILFDMMPQPAESKAVAQRRRSMRASMYAAREVQLKQKAAQCPSSLWAQPYLKVWACIRRYRPRYVELCQYLRKTSSYFVIVTTVVLLNVAALMITHEGQSQSTTDAQEYIGICCTVVFLIELVVEVGALGPHKYLSEADNVLSFVVCLIAILDLYVFVSGECNDEDNQFIKVVRCFRVTRIFKLFSPIPSLRVLLIALVRPMHTLCSIALLLFLVLIAASNFAFCLYKDIDLSDLGNNINFGTTYNAMITLFYFVTGENYLDVLTALRDQPLMGFPQWLWDPVCIMFTSTFVLVMNFLAINMFIMVVVDSYELVSSENYGMTERDLLDFTRHWMVIASQDDTDEARARRLRKRRAKQKRKLSSGSSSDLSASSGSSGARQSMIASAVHSAKITTSMSGNAHSLLVMDELKTRRFLRGLPTSVTGFRDPKHVPYLEFQSYWIELDLPHFKTSRRLFLGSDRQPWARPREDKLYDFRRVLLACNRVVFLRKNHTSPGSGLFSPEKRVATEQAAFRIQHWWMRLRLGDVTAALGVAKQRKNSVHAYDVVSNAAEWVAGCVNEERVLREFWEQEQQEEEAPPKTTRLARVVNRASYAKNAAFGAASQAKHAALDASGLARNVLLRRDSKKSGGKGGNSRVVGSR